MQANRDAIEHLSAIYQLRSNRDQVANDGWENYSPFTVYAGDFGLFLAQTIALTAFLASKRVAYLHYFGTFIATSRVGLGAATLSNGQILTSTSNCFGGSS